jgi:hypothetical protein
LRESRQRSVHAGRHRFRLRGGSDARTDRADRRHDVGQRLVLVAEIWNAGAIEPFDQLLLRRVDGHQVRLDRENALDAWIEQPANARQAFDVGGEVIVVADCCDAGAVPHRIDHLGDGRDERDDRSGARPVGRSRFP